MNENLQLGFDRALEIDRRIDELLYTQDLKPFPITKQQREILRLMKWHKGIDRSLTIAVLSGKLSLSERKIKDAVRGLVVDFGVPIMGLRRAPYGYFVAVNFEEISEGMSTLKSEIVEIARRVRAVEGSNYLKEMLGQVAAELEQEAS